jgi:heptosyltransferase-2
MFRRIVVRGVNWIGDSVISVAALRETRRLFPQAHLTLLVRPWVAGLFEGTDLADDIALYDGRRASFWSGVATLRAGKFDAAILFQNSFEAAALAFAARIPTRIGYPTEGRGPLLTERIPLAAATHRKHQIFYYLDLISRLEERLTGASHVDFSSPKYALPVSDERRKSVRDSLVAAGADPGRPWAALAPGAANSRAKQWPPASFAALADLLAERDGCEVFLVGAPNESPICQDVADRARARDRVRTLAGALSLPESVAFLAECHLVVSNDTGPAYVAAALDRPLVTIFGPTDPNMIRPYSDTAHIARKLVHCAPCLLRDCPIDHRCLSDLTPEDVYRRARPLLNPSAAHSFASRSSPTAH